MRAEVALLYIVLNLSMYVDCFFYIAAFLRETSSRCPSPSHAQCRHLHTT